MSAENITKLSSDYSQVQNTNVNYITVEQQRTGGETPLPTRKIVVTHDGFLQTAKVPLLFAKSLAEKTVANAGKEPHLTAPFPKPHNYPLFKNLHTLTLTNAEFSRLDEGNDSFGKRTAIDTPSPIQIQENVAIAATEPIDIEQPDTQAPVPTGEPMPADGSNVDQAERTATSPVNPEQEPEPIGSASPQVSEPTGEPKPAEGPNVDQAEQIDTQSTVERAPNSEGDATE